MNQALAESGDTLHPAADLMHDAHFLRAVESLVAKQPVATCAAIYTDNGTKLLDKGANVDARLYAQLIARRLAAPLDEQLLPSNAVDLASIEAQVMVLCGANPLGRVLVHALGNKKQWLQETLRHVKWAQHASFKMTVMRHHMPKLYEHSLLVMMVSVFLGLKQGMGARECSELAVAALLHDVGMLYMPPNWQNPKHKLSPEEQRQLAAHSITGMLVVRAAHAYSSAVEDAVLEHHERIDGSGYPRALKGAEISAWGRILMLAEVVVAFFDKYADMPAQRLSLMLRMNHRRFDTPLVQHVLAVLAQVPKAHSVSVGADSANTENVRKVVGELSSIFQHWATCKRYLPVGWQNMPGARACMYVELRLQALEKSLAESGTHPGQQADWPAMFAEDPSSAQELLLINKEALWQVEHCVEACLRRWPALLQPVAAVDVALAQWLQACRKLFGSTR